MEAAPLGDLRVQRAQPCPFTSELQGRLKMVSVHPMGVFNTDTQMRWGGRKKTPRMGW